MNTRKLDAGSIRSPMLEAYERELSKQLEDHLMDIARPIIKQKAQEAMAELKTRVESYRDIRYDEIIVRLESSFKD